MATFLTWPSRVSVKDSFDGEVMLAEEIERTDTWSK